MKKTVLTSSLLASVLILTNNVALSETAEKALGKVGNTIDTSLDKLGQSVEQADKYLSDSAITTKVKAEFVKKSELGSHDISVKTVKGEVALTGFVTSREQADLAIQTAKGVEGVTGVKDELQIQTGESNSFSQYVSDSAITAEVKARLLADNSSSVLHIKVQTADGVVLLTGTAKEAAHSERAAQIAKSISGVKKVNNQLVVQ